MKVYFLGYTMNYDGCHHHGIFSSEKNAEEYKKTLIENGKKENKGLDWHYYIIEYEVDEPLQGSPTKETEKK